MFKNTTHRTALYLLIAPLLVLAGCSTAKLDVTSSPTHADIYLNSEYVGRTPLKLPLPLSDEVPANALSAVPLFPEQYTQLIYLDTKALPDHINFAMDNPTDFAAAHRNTEAQNQAPAPIALAAALVPDVVDTQTAKQAVPIPSIYFETNDNSISPKAQSGLRINAAWLKKQPTHVTLRLEGHCDERGSDTYNLRLGERRAQAAKAYLVGLGIDASRLKTISYGEQKTAAEVASQLGMKFDRRVTMVPETGTAH